MAEAKVISPQPGYQMMALSSSADIVIGGGAAGAGKTFSLLLDPLRDIKIPDFNAVIFRRTTPQITAAGGLWDESKKLYPYVAGKANETQLNWTFPTGSKLKFSHLEHEKNVTSWQGSQIPFIGLDELTHFSKDTFFYLLSRNRSTCGVKPRVRATCNPDPDSWLYEIIKWWIGDDGFPIPERQGVIRYFAKDGDTMIWASTVDECIKKASYFIFPLSEKAGLPPENFIKSLTFIGGSVYENKALLSVNPEYLANLAAQSSDSKLQLLDGNWKVSLNPSDVYDYNHFRDVFKNNFVKPSDKRITVDVAMGGKDKLIISYFEGYRLEDILIIDKSSGKDVIDAITLFQSKHQVGNSKVIYDADGVGAFIGGENNGFIEGAIAFHNGSKAIETNDKRKFYNLKTQCFIYSGERVSRSESFISENVANTMYDDKMTVRQRLMFERKAIKTKVQRDEEPVRLIGKDEMKQKYLTGGSPDLLDGFMMNEYFDIMPKIYVHETEISANDLGLF
ncbi:terminase large subunit domain-containing protein [Changchengzhania lutea]|uniref:terminase large subunit domain-containing protein n=1 Tax=Changchengzhania lutea TaxID=2049305 RepID=UPI00163D896C|nr:terminase family protein [Changchengzhania lutea]